MSNTRFAGEQMRFKTMIKGLDLARSGETAVLLKKALEKRGVRSNVARRVAVAAYEVEMNIATHAYEGVLEATINPGYVEILAVDKGPGIPDIDLALSEGYSTAAEEFRELGFGAGMGLPNIKNNVDVLEIESSSEKGTKLRALIWNSNN